MQIADITNSQPLTNYQSILCIIEKTMFIKYLFIILFIITLPIGNIYNIIFFIYLKMIINGNVVITIYCWPIYSKYISLDNISHWVYVVK